MAHLVGYQHGAKLKKLRTHQQKEDAGIPLLGRIFPPREGDSAFIGWKQKVLPFGKSRTFCGEVGSSGKV
jgi:hypothetical protein